MKPDDLSERLLDLAVRVGKVVDALPDTRLGQHIAGQLVRSGTAPAPNYEEACAAESRRDFIHKVRIALKELRETRCWIKLIMRSELLPEARMCELANETDELCRILGQSLVTARKNEEQAKAKCAKPIPK
ncbi:four helix bundle protein [Stieleria mannarensis]|uniref:four helix bundle protein n=1 Tax=Stieleria mannarensis TaxID=2755585 RepID=UPI0016044604|nr:four helix bundle protein [Rhodopirellula sp. JC639]